MHEPCHSRGGRGGVLNRRVAFYQVYGQTRINQDAICYYRFERIIQDVGEYCEHIFLSDKASSNRIQ